MLWIQIHYIWIRIDLLQFRSGSEPFYMKFFEKTVQNSFGNSSFFWKNLCKTTVIQKMACEESSELIRWIFVIKSSILTYCMWVSNPDLNWIRIHYSGTLWIWNRIPNTDPDPHLVQIRGKKCKIEEKNSLFRF